MLAKGTAEAGANCSVAGARGGVYVVSRLMHLVVWRAAFGGQARPTAPVC
jgi:hypothetical protein